MANQKELALLSAGKTIWNTWRREHAEIQALEPDLHDADLHGADLQGFDLLHADLTGANLREADLRGTDLREADLRNADLRGANLSDANLLKAHLRYADLRGARRDPSILAERREQVRKALSAERSSDAPDTAAERRLEELADEHAKRRSITKAAAYDEVLQSDEGRALYAKHRAKRRSAA